MAPSKQSSAYYDPSERVREKQASREADYLAVAAGEKTIRDIRAENGFLPLQHAAFDPSRLSF